jgi:hypothetical protein
MADLKCSLCGDLYTDETGHDKQKCAERLALRVSLLEHQLKITRASYKEAMECLRKEIASKAGFTLSQSKG